MKELTTGQDVALRWMMAEAHRVGAQGIPLRESWNINEREELVHRIADAVDQYEDMLVFHVKGRLIEAIEKGERLEIDGVVDVESRLRDVLPRGADTSYF